MTVGETLFRVAVRAAVSIAFPSVEAVLTLGDALRHGFTEELRERFANAAWGWLKHLPIARQDEALSGMASIPHDQACCIVREELQGKAIASDATVARAVGNRLAAVPMTTKHALGDMHAAGHASAATCLTRVPDPLQRLAQLVPDRSPLFEPGHRLENTDYILTTLLGQGGMGEVWQAKNEHLASHEPVAIKFCSGPEFVPMLQREAAVLNRLDNDREDHGVIRLKGTNLRAERKYLVYEHIHGGTLQDWIALYPGPVPVRRVLSMLKKIARALAHAHQHNLVHRDVKPTNVLVGTAGVVKLTDWGIAMDCGTPEDGERIMHGNTVVQSSGTPMYRDPLIKPGTPAVPAHDIYSFGIVACQMLVGDMTRPPSLAWMQHVAAARLEDVPKALLDVIGRCVAPEAMRLENGRALLTALESIELPSLSKKATLIKGTVRCSASGEPVARAGIALSSEGRSIMQLHCSPLGTFSVSEVSGTLQGTSVSCVVTHDGYVPHEVHRLVEADQVVFDVVLTRRTRT